MRCAQCSIRFWGIREEVCPSWLLAELTLPYTPRTVADRIHPAGALTHRDLVSILPMLDDTVVIRVTGTPLVSSPGGRPRARGIKGGGGVVT